MYLRLYGERALVLIGETTLELPSDIVRNPKKLLEELIKQDLLPDGGQKVLIADGDGNQINFSQVFQDHLLLESVGLDVEMILRNADQIHDLIITPEETIIFSAIPADQEELINIGMDPDDPEQASVADWSAIKNQTLAGR